MTAKKKITDKNGVQVFPITHTKAVLDDNGNSVEQRLQEQMDVINQKQLEVGAVPSDVIPTENSTNWVTSGGVYDAIKPINKAIFAENIVDITGQVITGSRTSLNGTIVSGAKSQRTDYINISEYSEILVSTCLFRSSANNDETIVFFDENKQPKRIIKPSDYGISAGNYIILDKESISILSEEVFVIVSGRYNIDGAVPIGVFERELGANKIEIIDEKVKDINNTLYPQFDIDTDELDYENRGYDGIRYPNSSTRTAAVLYRGEAGGCSLKSKISTGNVMFHYWHSNNNDVSLETISVSKGDVFLKETGWDDTTEDEVVPNNCNVIILQFKTRNIDAAKTYISDVVLTSNLSINEKVDRIKDSVDNIEEKLIKNSVKPFYIETSFRSAKLLQDVSDEIIVKDASDKITHDATHIVNGNKLYIVYCANQNDTGDSGEFSDYAVVRLDVFEINGNNFQASTLLQRIVVGADGYAVGSGSISGGAGVPNAYLVGTTLHIIFGAKIDTTWTEIHVAYNTQTDSLGNLEQCRMDNSPLTGAVLASHSSLSSTFNSQLSFNASIAEMITDDITYYYACICSAARINKGLIVRTTDFVDWEFVAEPAVNSSAQYEGAMGSYNNYLYLALRQTTNNILLAKLKNNGDVLEQVMIAGVNSRPAFYKQDGNLYAILPSGNRATSTFYFINDSVYSLIQEASITGANKSLGQYMEVAVANPSQYIGYSKTSSGTFVRIFKTDVLRDDSYTANKIVDIILNQSYD